mgnify:CR=1 FL=1
MSEQDENKLISQRREKLDAIRSERQAFPNEFARQHIAAELHTLCDGKSKTELEELALGTAIAGRIVRMRGPFVVIKDASGQIQLYMNNKSFSEDEFPSLDLNKDQNEIVQNALTSCKDVNFENLLNSRKEKLGVSEPDKTINKKKELDNSLGIEVSRSIETIYTPEQSLDNVNKILSSIKDDRLYPAIKYYIIKDFAFYESGLCKSLKNHFDTYKAVSYTHLTLPTNREV